MAYCTDSEFTVAVTEAHVDVVLVLRASSTKLLSVVVPLQFLEECIQSSDEASVEKSCNTDICLKHECTQAV